MTGIKVYVNGNWVELAGRSVWGMISGAIADQTDLKDALDSKVPTSRTICSKPLSGNIELTPGDVGVEIVDTW